MASTTAWVARNIHDLSAWRNTTPNMTARMTSCPACSRRRRRGSRAAVPNMLGGGSTAASGSPASRSWRMPGTNASAAKRRRNGTAGVSWSWIGRSQLMLSLQRGMNVVTCAISTPSPTPPASAHGRLTRRPIAAAAMATTMRLRKSCADSVLNLGAISTPATPANSDDSAHANAETRSALMPLSSVMRGLSTTDPHAQADGGLKRNSAASARRDDGEQGDAHRHELVATERVDAERVVEHRVAIGHHPLRSAAARPGPRSPPGCRSGTGGRRTGRSPPPASAARPPLGGGGRSAVPARGRAVVPAARQR